MNSSVGWILLGRNIVGLYIFLLHLHNEINWIQSAIDYKQNDLYPPFVCIVCVGFSLWSKEKLAHSHSVSEKERTLWAVVRKWLRSETRLLLLHLLVFSNHFYYLLNEYVTILRCSLIFIARKFTPFILTAKNKGIELIFSLAHQSTTTENRFLLFFLQK